MFSDVPGFEEYFQVSKDGFVFSKRTNKVLVSTLSKTGYLCVASKIGGRKGKAVCLKVHRMVATAYLDNPGGLPEVNHIDGVKTNNHVSNLEWVSRRTNSRHAVEHGLMVGNSIFVNGKYNYRCYLTAEQVMEIRKSYTPRDKEFGARPLGRKYGVPHASIVRICKNTQYRDPSLENTYGIV